MLKKFINLTNGIESIPSLGDDWSAIRICSTTIEKRDWLTLIGDLDHNLLFWLSQGADCVIYDYGARRPISKTVSFGVPLIKSVLERVWLNRQVNSTIAHAQCIRLLQVADTHQKQTIKRKLLYYRRLLRTDEVRLRGCSAATEHDGDVDYYKGILSQELDKSS